LGILTSLDNEQVLGVDVAVLGEVEVLLCDENALCGDRVSAYPYMQHSREIVQECHSHGSVAGGILTSEEVPGECELALFIEDCRTWRDQMKLKLKTGYFVRIPLLDCAAVMAGVEED
jgi:hypothetical protein